MNRRGFLTGIIAACAAPAIVRSGLIMPIKPALLTNPYEIWEYTGPQNNGFATDYIAVVHPSIERELPRHAAEWGVLMKFAQSKPLPKYSGDTIRFRRPRIFTA